MKTLLIGNGYWGGIIKPKLQALTDLICVADSKSSIDLLLKCDIDFVFVCSSVESHYDIVKMCIENKKNVFCEKPFTGNLNMAKELYKLADGKIKIFVDNIFLYRPEFVEMSKVKFNIIKFIWKKYDTNNEDIMDRLVYHDLYMLIDMTDDKWIILKNINKNGRVDIEMVNEGKIAKFEYDMNYSGKEKLIIIDDRKIDFSNPKTDPLMEVIRNICDDKIDYESNKKLTISTLKILDRLKNDNK